MRALTEQEIAVISAPDGYTVQARVWLWDGAAFQNISTLAGRDWLVDVTWDESINEPCAQATVTLRRRLHDFNLNPLVSNALTGVLALARPFFIETATVPLGDTPAPADWVEVFRGQVEELTLDKDPLTFTGRDQAGVLLRTFIEVEREYGSDSGVPVETVMQSILTDNGTGVALHHPTATLALLGKYKAKKDSVMTAVRERALAIGWDVRMWWDDVTGTFRFTLLKPDRNDTVSRWSFLPRQVRQVTRLAQSMMDVRNAGELYYYNRSATDAGGKPTLAFVTTSDSASIAKYGRLYMQLAEDENSPIDSPAEAQAMLNAAISDLKEPLLDFGVEVGFHYGVQLNDMLTFVADGENFSSNQTLAVVSIAHSISVNGHKTTLSLRGKPVGAQDDWLRREARVLRQPRVAAPDTVSGLTATATTGGVVVSFAAPTAPPLPTEYELHVSTTPGFTPSAATLRERANRTRFEVTGLTPGATYYLKVVPRDVAGNRGAASTQVSVMPRYVSPGVLTPKVSFGTIPLNGDLEALTDPSQPPDATTVSGGTWGTDVAPSTDAYAGARSLLWPAGLAPATLATQAFTVRAGEQWTFSVWFKQDTAGVRSGTLGVSWQNGSGGTVTYSNIALGASTTPASTWQRGVLSMAVPSGARYAVLVVEKWSGYTGSFTVDSIDAFRQQAFESWRSVTWQNGWLPWNSAIYGPVWYRRNDAGEVQVKGAAGAPSPAPAANSILFTLLGSDGTATGYRPNERRLFTTSTGSAAVDVEIWPDGTVRVPSVAAGARVPLDMICFQADS